MFRIVCKKFSFKCEYKNIPSRAKGTYTFTSTGELLYTNPNNETISLNNKLPLPDKIKKTDVTNTEIFIDTSTTFNNQSYAFDNLGKLCFITTMSYSTFDINTPYAEYVNKTDEFFINIFNPLDNSIKSFDEDISSATPRGICVTQDGKWIFTYATYDSYDLWHDNNLLNIGRGVIRVTSTDFKIHYGSFFSTPNFENNLTTLIVSLCTHFNQLYFSYFDNDKKINRIYECVPRSTYPYAPYVYYFDIPFTRKLNLISNNEGVWGITEGKKGNTSQIIKLVDEKGKYLITENSFDYNIQAKGYYLQNPSIVAGDNYLLYVPDTDGKILKYENGKIQNVTKLAEKKHKYTTEDLLEVKEKIAQMEIYNESNNEDSTPSKLYFIIIAILVAIICVLIITVIQISIHTNQIRKDKKFIFSIQETERGKISRDIHDSIIQDIRSIRIESELLNVTSESEARKNKIINMATDCVVKLRNICYNLTTAELATHSEGDSSKIELVSMIQSLVVQFIERTHVPCQLKIDEHFDYPVLEKDISQNLFRIIQEALNNIEKHSYATSCQILIKNKIEDEKKFMLIYISDDGVGCDVKQMLKVKKRLHFGVHNMMDRASLIGAEINFQSEIGHGLEVRIKI